MIEVSKASPYPLSYVHFSLQSELSVNEVQLCDFNYLIVLAKIIFSMHMIRNCLQSDFFTFFHLSH